MVKPPKKWTYILIELEIDGVVVESKVATQVTFEKTYKNILYEGQTQRLPWAIFISQFYYKNPTAIDYRERDKNGRYLKTQNIENARDFI